MTQEEERETNALQNENAGDAIKRYQWITARALDASGPARSQFDRPTAASRLV